jgi:hypothetical protein
MTLIQFKRGTAADMTSVNPVLAAGEPGLESDTGLYKIGDGVKTWTALPYESDFVGKKTVDLTGVATGMVLTYDGTKFVVAAQTVGVVDGGVVHP